MQNPRLVISSALALAGAVVCAAGCGGGSSSSPRSSVTDAGGSAVSAPASVGTSKSRPPSSASTTGASTSPLSIHGTTTGKSPTLPQPIAGGGDPKAIAAAETICARRSAELGRSPMADISNLSALAAVVQHRVEIERHALSELTRLKPPPAIAPAYRKLIAADRAALLLTVKLGERAQAGDVAGVRPAREKVENGDLRLLVAATKTPLDECAAVG